MLGIKYKAIILTKGKDMLKNNYKKMPLNELINYAKTSDLKALEELIRRIQKDIYTFFIHVCAPEDIVSDLTQETLIKIVKNISALRESKSFNQWSHKIAINTLYDNIRKSNKENNIVSELKKDLDISKYQEYTPQECSQNKEIECKIKMCIINLPINTRLALILREFNGFSYAEIAKLTNSNLGTVKSRISRAREKLQQELVNYI